MLEYIHLGGTTPTAGSQEASGYDGIRLSGLRAALIRNISKGSWLRLCAFNCATNV
jgi:hypothetical protein